MPNMNPLRILLLLGFLALILLPVSAGHPIENVTIVPDKESYSAGTPLSLTTTVRIIPPGPTTTFVEWDELVLGTELENPHWDVVAIAGQQRVEVPHAEGQVVRVPGYLLSYSVDRQVSVSISLEGTVPYTTEQRLFVVLSVDEQNDRGVSVYGPADTISRIAFPSAQKQPVSTLQPSANVALSPLFILVALAGGLVILWWNKR